MAMVDNAFSILNNPGTCRFNVKLNSSNIFLWKLPQEQKTLPQLTHTAVGMPDETTLKEEPLSPFISTSVAVIFRLISAAVKVSPSNSMV